MADDNIIPLEKWNDRWKREELITRRRRVRRELRLPDELMEARSARFPYRLPPIVPGLEARYRRGRWFDLNERSREAAAEDGWDSRLLVRHTTARILKEGRHVGELTFAEYNVPVFFDDEFTYWMDAHEEHMGRLAEYCCASWPDFTQEVSAYGNVVELQTIWTDPRELAPGAWRPFLDAFLKKFGRKGALLVAHAFPLEYGGRAAPEDASYIGFRRRRAAMVAWAKRNLGLQSFPGKPGDEGWLWAAFPRVAQHIDPPERFNADWREGH